MSPLNPAAMRLRIIAGGQEIENLAVVVLADHHDQVIVTTFPDAHRRIPDQTAALRDLRRVIERRAAAEERYPPVDTRGQWQVRVGEAGRVADVAVAAAGCHDGLVAATVIPDRAGHAPDASDVLRLLSMLADGVKPADRAFRRWRR